MLSVSKHIAAIFLRLSLLTFCGLASAYILASGYESIYNRPVPFVRTIAAVNLTDFTGVYQLSKSVIPKSSYYGSFGKPVTLKLPASALRLNIVSAIADSGNWLARPSTLQLLIPKPPRNGNIGVAFLYCRSGFRTINVENLPKAGQNIFMDTDEGWRYVYKVMAARVYTSATPYIPSDDGSTGKLIINCYDDTTHTNSIVEADLLSVQGVEQ